MKLKLQLSSEFIIDTSDLDPQIIADAIADLSLYTDENGDELKKFEDLDSTEILGVIHKLLEDDIDSVCDLGVEIDASDFNITIVETELQNDLPL